MGKPIEKEPEERPFPAIEVPNGLSRFRGPDDPLGVFDDILPLRHDKFGKPVWLSHGPAMWLRVMPSEDIRKKFDAEKLKAIANSHPALVPLSSTMYYGETFHVLAQDGYGAYAPIGNRTPQADDQFIADQEKERLRVDDKIFSADLTTFVFETGELWGIDIYTLRRLFGRGIPPIVEKSLRLGLMGYAGILKRLGVRPPYKWIAGMEGIEGESICVPVIPDSFYAHSEGRGKCTVNSVTAEGLYKKGVSPAKTLAPFFRNLYEACNVDRPEWLNDD